MTTVALSRQDVEAVLKYLPACRSQHGKHGGKKKAIPSRRMATALAGWYGQYSYQCPGHDHWHLTTERDYVAGGVRPHLAHRGHRWERLIASARTAAGERGERIHIFAAPDGAGGWLWYWHLASRRNRTPRTRKEIKNVMVFPLHPREETT